MDGWIDDWSPCQQFLNLNWINQLQMMYEIDAIETPFMRTYMGTESELIRWENSHVRCLSTDACRLYFLENNVSNKDVLPWYDEALVYNDAGGIPRRQSVEGF